MLGRSNSGSGGRRRAEGYTPLLQGLPEGGSSSGGAAAEGAGGGWTPGQDIQGHATRIPILGMPMRGGGRMGALGGGGEGLSGRSASDDGSSFTLGFAAGRAAAAGLRAALAGAAGGAGQSSGGAAAGGGGGAGSSASAGGAPVPVGASGLLVNRKSLEWIPSKVERADGAAKGKAPKGAARAMAPQGQIALRQRDKFVPLPGPAAHGMVEEEVEEEEAEPSTSAPAPSTLEHELSRSPMYGSDLGQQYGSTGDQPGMMEKSAEQQYSSQQYTQQYVLQQQRQQQDAGTALPAPVPAPPGKQASGAAPKKEPPSSRGRITVYCIAEGLERSRLTALMRSRYKSAAVHTYLDVVHLCITDDAAGQQAGQAGQNGAGSRLSRSSITGGSGTSGGGSAGALGGLGSTGGGRPTTGAAAAPPAAVPPTAAGASIVADAFFFDYGVIICWGLSEQSEKELVKQVGKACEAASYQPGETGIVGVGAVTLHVTQVCEVASYQPDEVEIDEFTFNYSATEPPHIKNDMFTINKRQASDHQVRLAISHALAQSAKLSVYEERVLELVDETRDLPETLATHGKVNISSKKVAKLIGKVFLQSSTVNLLSTVLDTPEYFWSAPDSLQSLYERACEYLELETRVEVLNARFQVLQEMLDMLRDHQNNSHASRLEWIIIILLCADCLLMLFQLLGLFGLV